MDKRPVMFQEIRSAKQVSVIVVVFKRGAGIEDDPVRVVTQYWSMGGRLLAECDPEQAPWLAEDEEDLEYLELCLKPVVAESPPVAEAEALTVALSTGQGALMVTDLLKLSNLLGVSEDAGLYVCDPLDPDRRFIIRRVPPARERAEKEQ